MSPGNTLGLFIASRRRELKLSLADVARCIGVNKSTVQRLEQGTIRSVTPETVVQLATALQVPLAELWSVAGLPRLALPCLQDYLTAAYGPLPDDVITDIAERLARAQAQCGY